MIGLLPISSTLSTISIIRVTLNTEVYTLWLFPRIIESAVLNRTNGTLVDKEGFEHQSIQPPYTNFKLFQIIAFLKEVKAPSFGMRPLLEQYNPACIPEEAGPTPPPPIVERAEEVSSDDDSLAAMVAAETAGGKLLHNYLLTRNTPSPARSQGGYVLLRKIGPKVSQL